MFIQLQKDSCNTEAKRKAIAETVSKMFGTDKYPGIPYKPNEHDSTFWTVDAGNDWKIYFRPDAPDSISIVYRYAGRGTREIADSFTRWVAYRLGGTLVEE